MFCKFLFGLRSLTLSFVVLFPSGEDGEEEAAAGFLEGDIEDDTTDDDDEDDEGDEIFDIEVVDGDDDGMAGDDTDDEELAPEAEQERFDLQIPLQHRVIF